MQRLNQLRVGETVPELLEAGLELERAAVDFLRGAIEHCGRVGDYMTRAMFEATISDEETHVDWFETQMLTRVRSGLGPSDRTVFKRSRRVLRRGVG
jgi:bacterioferritin